MTKTAKHDPQVPAGRIAFDDRGNAVWQWRSDTGTFKSDVDTNRVRQLQEATTAQLGGEAQVATSGPRPPGNDPYNTADSRTFVEKAGSRRTPGDMHRLSEEIKRARALKK